MEQFRANGVVEKLTKEYLSIVEKECTSPMVKNNSNNEHKWVFLIAYLFLD
jgi:hypothetical protein